MGRRIKGQLYLDPETTDPRLILKLMLWGAVVRQTDMRAIGCCRKCAFRLFVHPVDSCIIGAATVCQALCIGLVAKVPMSLPWWCPSSQGGPTHCRLQGGGDIYWDL